MFLRTPLNQENPTKSKAQICNQTATSYFPHGIVLYQFSELLYQPRCNHKGHGEGHSNGTEINTPATRSFPHNGGLCRLSLFRI